MAFHSGLVEWLATRAPTFKPKFSEADPKAAVFDLARLALNLRQRRLPRREWRVKATQHLVDVDLVGRHRAALLHLMGAASLGLDMVPYQSELVDNPYPLDHLRSDWNIHHLHLGVFSSSRRRKRRKVGFSGRSSDLAFVFPTQEQLIFIGVFDHESFEDLALLEVLKSTFPEVLEPFLARGIINAPIVTKEERKALRKNGVGVLTTTVDGQHYFPMGGGIVTSGSPIDAVIGAQQLLRLCKPTVMARALLHSGVVPPPNYQDVRVTFDGELRPQVLLWNFRCAPWWEPPSP